MWVRADEVARRRQRGRGTVASAYVRWRQQGFVTVQRREPSDLERFDRTMYRPFANARFGEAAATLDRATMRRALERGTIVWVEQEGRAVAAQLLERCGSTLHTVSVGTCLDPAAAQATGGADRAESGGERSGARDRARVDRLRRLHAVAHGRGAAEQAPMGCRARPSWRPASRRARQLGPVDARRRRLSGHGPDLPPRGGHLCGHDRYTQGNQAAERLGFNGIDRLLVVDEAAAGTGAVATPGSSGSREGVRVNSGPGRAAARWASGPAIRWSPPGAFPARPPLRPALRWNPSGQCQGTSTPTLVHWACRFVVLMPGAFSEASRRTVAKRPREGSLTDDSSLRWNHG